MTYEEMLELARRAVACPQWRWMAGMAFELVGIEGSSCGWRVQRSELRCLPGWSRAVRVVTSGQFDFIIGPRGSLHSRCDGGPSSPLRRREMLPDLTDPATLGCLLALVREAHGTPTAEWRGISYVAPPFVVCYEGLYSLRRDCGDGDEALFDDGQWSSESNRKADGALEICFPTEAEALVAALEVAE